MANPLQQIIAQQRAKREQQGEGEYISCFKSFLNHAGLYAGLVAYTAVGAGVSFNYSLYHLQVQASSIF